MPHKEGSPLQIRTCLELPSARNIFFVDADSQIVNIAKYTTPYSSEQIQPGEPAQFVLEIPAGFADSHGLLEGDRIRWRRLE